MHETATQETTFVTAPPEITGDVHLVFDPKQMKIKDVRRVEALQKMLKDGKRNPTFDEMIELMVSLCPGLTAALAEELTIQQVEDFWGGLNAAPKIAVPKASGTPSLSASKGTKVRRPAGLKRSFSANKAGGVPTE